MRDIPQAKGVVVTGWFMSHKNNCAQGERDMRRGAMCSWTMEALKELGAENWAPVFRFSSLSLETMYSAGIFEEPVWYRGDVEKPVRLFGG